MKTNRSFVALVALLAICASCQHDDGIAPGYDDRIVHVDLEPDLVVGSVSSTGVYGVIPPDSTASLGIALLDESGLMITICSSHWQNPDAPNAGANYYVSAAFTGAAEGKVALIAVPGEGWMNVRAFQEGEHIGSGPIWDAAGTIYWDQPSIPSVPTHGTNGNFYMGLQVRIDGEVHYGWMALNNSNCTVTIRSYAVNLGQTHWIRAGQVE